MSIPQLPNELFFYIYDYSDIETRDKLRQVCDKKTGWAFCKQSMEPLLKARPIPVGFYDLDEVVFFLVKFKSPFAMLVQKTPEDDFCNDPLIWLRALSPMLTPLSYQCTNAYTVEFPFSRYFETWNTFDCIAKQLQVIPDNAWYVGYM